MPAIGTGNGFTISTPYGSSFLEGSLPGSNEGGGRQISFTITQSPIDLRTAYVKVVPISGSPGDFWDYFWSNRVTGEPADDFALSSFVAVESSATFSLYINADSYNEIDEVFELRLFESHMDAAYGYPPLISIRFKIIDDDLIGSNSSDRLEGRIYAENIKGHNGNDTLLGYGGNDSIDGGAGNDIINGGAGNDLIFGGLGQDIMAGGIGADKFVFSRINQSSISKITCDVVNNFVTGIDKINLRAIDAFSSTTSTNDKFKWNTGSSFSNTREGEVLFKQVDNDGSTNDATMIYIDTDGDVGAEMLIRLNGLHDLTASDFIL